jgi:tetratricopeptide (TPR) repeat protein
MEGRYSDAASAAQHFLEIGNRVHDQNAPQSFGAHFFLQLWEQNKLNEVSVLVEDFITKHPLIPAWKCAALFVHSEIRNPEAVSLFDEFSEFGFDSLPLNETWAIAIQMLSNACVNIGCDSSAHQLYDLSLAGKMHHTIVGYGVMSWGSRARELGNLASLMGRFEEAEEHFELAVTQNRKTGAAPWVAHSQFDYAKMLARQRDSSHTGRIRELVADAQQAANTLGMVRLKLQIGEFIKEL